MKITEKVSPEFPNYIVKSDGTICNKNGAVLRQHEKAKYKNVWLYKDKKRHFKLVHRLVAETFIPNEKNLPEVNHKDENPSNNRVENLEWCDRKYNVNYGTLKERMRARMIANNPFKGRTHTLETKKKISDKKTGQLSKRKRVVVIHGQKYGSVTMAMKVLGLSTRALYKLIKE